MVGIVVGIVVVMVNHFIETHAQTLNRYLNLPSLILLI
jgi:hypothetical protein